ncbi:MAG: TauD/TfdA family dioxygenase [Acidiferrobacterales bacterium]
MVPKPQTLSARHCPFRLGEPGTYRSWRQKKLKNYPASTEELVVEIKNPRALTANEKFLVVRACRKTNMVLYSSRTEGDADKQIPLSLGRQLGLNQLDHNWLADKEGVTSLTVREDAEHNHYIPYTNRRIRWHTDGYYNPLHRQIGALLLHCVSSAASGGENALLDHEIAYIKIRDENPDYIRALMAPDVMTIPARLDESGVARPDQSGPVFSIDAASGNLHMRYTARTRSIQWKDDPLTREATEFLTDLLNGDSTYIFRGRLEPGMGLISNNVLHDRSGFVDGVDSRRLLYRARYFERLEGTGVYDIPPFRRTEN